MVADPGPQSRLIRVTVSLRPHHLLCLLTYAGHGYSPAFTANFDVLTARLKTGENIVLVEGPDDVCAGWFGDPEAHCRRGSITVRDAAARAELSQLLGQDIAGLTHLPPLDELRAAFAAHSVRTACLACEWHDLCSGIAKDGFSGTRMAV